MKIKKSIIWLILLAIFISESSYAVNAQIEFSQHCKSKVSTDLVEIAKNSNNEQLPIIVWFDDATLEVNRAELISDVLNDFNISSAQQFKNLSTDDKFEIVHKIKELNRTKMKAHYENYNLQRVKELKNYGNIRFINSYSPFICMEVETSQLKEISKNSEVSQICYDYDINFEPLLNTSRQVIRANTVQVNGVFGETGNGVRVGIIDGGKPNLTNGSLQDANIIIDPNYANNISYNSHATYVAQIIAGQPSANNATGIAPGASLYCTAVPDGTSYHFNALNWLVDNNVDIVNISFDWSEYDSSGNIKRNEYYGFSQILDYYSENYMVTYVVSCGNSGTNGVGSPAMSYNAISVGNLNDNNTVTASDDSIHYTSSHINQSVLTNLPSKPDLCAPGTNITINSQSVSGTSFSAPHVTGVAALLGEMDPLLLISPPAIKAALVAGAKSNFRFVPSQRTITTNTSNPPESYIQCGAGLIDAVRSGYIAKQYQIDFGVMSKSTTEISFEINLTANTNTRIALTFEKSIPENSDGFLQTNHYDNLDLYVYNTNGNIIGSSTTTNNNVEIVDFTATYTGKYTIKIKRIATQYPTDVRYAYAWC